MALTKHLTCNVLSNPYSDSIIITTLILQMSEFRLKGHDDDYMQKSLVGGPVDLLTLY